MALLYMQIKQKQASRHKKGRPKTALVGGAGLAGCDHRLELIDEGFLPLDDGIDQKRQL